jgi:hypothetical protein
MRNKEARPKRHAPERVIVNPNYIRAAGLPLLQNCIYQYVSELSRPAGAFENKGKVWSVPLSRFGLVF